VGGGRRPVSPRLRQDKRVNGEGLEWSDVYDRRLARWQLTGPQRREVARLHDVQRQLRAVLTQILEPEAGWVSRRPAL
jgi:hypothetical protein